MDKLVQKLFNSFKGNNDRKLSNRENKERLVDLLGDYLYVSDNSAGGVNFYPGNPGSQCSEKAYFVSLTKNMGNFDVDQSVPLEEMLRIMFKQVGVDCFNINKSVFLIVDEINMDVFEKYKKHFEFLKKIGVKLEITYFGNEEMKDFTMAILG